MGRRSAPCQCSHYALRDVSPQAKGPLGIGEENVYSARITVAKFAFGETSRGEAVILFLASPQRQQGLAGAAGS